MTITFPDTWKVQTDIGPYEVLTVEAPSDHANPVCKVTVQPDKRYVIFPPRLGKAVQKVAVSEPFWENYLADYDNYDIVRVYDGGGLGRWVASYAQAIYSRRDGTVYQQRRAIMFASLYNDTLYVVECSALNHAYENWQKNFMSVIKSVDFEKAYNELATGHYADFLRGANQYFWAPSGPEGTTAY